MKAGVLFLFSALAAGTTFAAQDELKTMMATSTIQINASTNETNLACGIKSEKEIDAERLKQKSAIIKDSGLSEAAYDKIYAESSATSKASWSRTSSANKKLACQQVKP
ncbi:MAG: hypothetical protein LBJ15_18505 [Comamonas sp.]|jgi:hypothetical protein|uniref:hypothetical protein n=1 Tax=Comamonas sp. TaxID=34028 RepID=UPI00282BF74A|nr:hypothetical protein [Comamonas sp.]MDR0215969.1 hypothetical protein [Comamonas sp.]